MDLHAYMDFMDKIATLEPREQALIDFNIYRHPDHVEYWIKAKCEDYDWCWGYLQSHRHLLTIEHTPGEYKEQAHRAMWSALELR